MKPERWRKIERIYNSALELDEDQREAFLEQACSGDKSIRKEVQRLLELNIDAEKFIESPAIEKLAHEMAADSELAKESSSIIGKSNSRYQIIEELGRGGMGEVYRAKDRKLGREVAIKVLPKEFAQDTDRIARFRREAKLLASLNHSNIAALYELEESGETHFLVLELIEGETLTERLKRGPIPVEESLKLALQIAEALEAAHEKGVIHRDLKPANIKITPDGNVKVLDFGLAKTFLKDQEGLNLTDSTTLNSTLTQKGFILGTASYMSTEQAQGQTVDKRTDIWAFGCVLYEMLTGKPAFPGKTVTEILAAIIRVEPDWHSLPANLHWRLREVLERCLKKETKDRYHDISDVRVDTQKILADPSGPLTKPASVESRMMSRMTILWIFTAVIFTTIISVVAGWNLKQTEPLHTIRFDHNLPEDQHFNINTGGTLAVSHDGSQFAYITNKGLYLRSMKDMNARLLLGANEKPQTPFFSTDDQWLGYWSESDKKLKKILISEGTPIALCDVDMMIWGASWYEDGTILYAEVPKGIMQISARGGNPEVLIEGPYAFPQLLPNGKSIIYTDVSTKPSYKIVAQSLESGEKEVLLTAGWAKYLTSRHLVYISDNNLFVVLFDPDTFEVIGGEVLIVENIFHLEGVYKYAVSDSGTLVYIPGTVDADINQNTLVWVYRDGKEEPLSPISQNYYSIFNISPDGTKVALAIIEQSGNVDIWISDFVSENLIKFTFWKDLDGCPLWTLDGQRIVFRSNREKGHDGIYWRAVNGTGQVEQLISVPQGVALFPWSWSGDGNTLVLTEITGNSYDIGTLSMEGNREIKPLFQGKHEEISPKISPDGKWIAYSSNESGQFEVYVHPFPNVDSGDRWQISNSGGGNSLWSRDGKELFYRKGDSFWAVAVKSEPIFEYGKPRFLFRGTYDFSWDVHPDGKRFLMIKPLVTTIAESVDDVSAPEIPYKINIVLNWLEELKERVPD